MSPCFFVTMVHMNCVFCDFATGEKECFKVWENEDFMAFLDINPVNPGHTLLIPKIHVSDVLGMEAGAYQQLFVAAKELASKMKAALGAPRAGLAVEGFGVDHVHVHLVPVYAGNELNPERAKSATQEELVAIQEKLSAALNY